MSGVQTLSSQNFVLFELFKFLAGAKRAAVYVGWSHEEGYGTARRQILN